jgi:hypothetical protein
MTNPHRLDGDKTFVSQNKRPSDQSHAVPKARADYTRIKGAINEGELGSIALNGARSTPLQLQLHPNGTVTEVGQTVDTTHSGHHIQNQSSRVYSIGLQDI